MLVYFVVVENGMQMQVWLKYQQVSTTNVRNKRHFSSLSVRLVYLFIIFEVDSFMVPYCLLWSTPSHMKFFSVMELVNLLGTFLFVGI